jgi:chromosomal replication initiator protein
MSTIDEIWKTTLAQIEVKLDSPAQYQTWFRDTKLIEIEGKAAKIGVKNSYASDWLKKKHNMLIKSTLSYVYGKEIDPIFEVYSDPALIDAIEEEVSNEAAPLLGVQFGMDAQMRSIIQSSGLNDRYTFSNFIVGESNRIAHAAALAVTEGLGVTYNPYFVYGPTGIGKTHLAQAIGRQILEKDPSKKVLYVTSEGFLNDLVKAIRSGKGFDFREKYRTIDLLIIDDIQFVSKWQDAQTEFFNTFNALTSANKQIVLISDRRPENIDNLEARLKSRFQGGIVVETSKPEYETRRAILEKKANDFGIEVNERVIDFVAKIVTDNVRELEGALQKISLYNSMKDEELSLEEIARILGKDAKAKREKIKIPFVLKKISLEFGVSLKDLKGPRRTSELAFARQVAMYILREEFNYRLEKVAELLNRKDHTTVIHAVDKIKSKIMIDDGFKSQITQLISALQNEEEVV